MTSGVNRNVMLLRVRLCVGIKTLGYSVTSLYYTGSPLRIHVCVAADNIVEFCP